MWSNVMIGFVVASGGAVWVYSRLHRQSGGNTQNAAIAAAMVGLFAWLVITVTLGMVFKN